METPRQPVPLVVPLDCTIFVQGNQATVTGSYPVKLVREVTSYLVEGHRFSSAFKRKVWDGYKHFFNLKTCKMPAGFVSLVERELKAYDPNGIVRVVYTDRQVPTRSASETPSFDLLGIEFGKGDYDYQLEAAKIAIEKRRGILKLATNAGKTDLACAITQYLGHETLFLITSLDLLYQTKERFMKRLGLPGDAIGLVGDGEFEMGRWITIATPESLLNRIDTAEVRAMIPVWKVVFVDECHQAGSDTFYDLLDYLPCEYRFGLSGTPLDRSDGADLRLIAQTGEVIYEVPNKLLIERGISVQPHIEIIKIEEPKLPKKLSWPEVHKRGLVENPTHNNKVVEKVLEYVKQGLQVVVMVEMRSHGQLLDAMITIQDSSIKHKYIHGDEDTTVRKKALKDLQSKKIQCLITTKILDQGIDTPAIDVLIFAAGGKGKIRTLQRIGRGIRKGKDKKKLIVVDFVNFCHRYLAEHSLQRLQIYKAEDCFVISTS